MTNPTTKLILALLTLALLTGEASAQQQRTIRDARGNVVARASTDSQGTTTIYDATGRVITRESTDSQGTTVIRDAAGKVVGTVTTRRVDRFL
jgi:YD repeat-containing protein